MDTQAIITALDKEIVRLQQARAILTAAACVNGGAASIKRGLGRPKKAAGIVAPVKRKSISPEARERIAAAQKARWAKVRKAAKKAAKVEGSA
jgi:hypothetical protein